MFQNVLSSRFDWRLILRYQLTFLFETTSFRFRAAIIESIRTMIFQQCVSGLDGRSRTRDSKFVNGPLIKKGRARRIARINKCQLVMPAKKQSRTRSHGIG
jgi:hypothetical protein